MDLYQIWVDLHDTNKDLEFCRAIDAYMGHLRERGLIQGHRISRRKLGFGPDVIGEFNITIEVKDLSQLEAAFGAAATRSGDVEKMHRNVFARVTNFRSALYRDFPDAVRERPAP